MKMQSYLFTLTLSLIFTHYAIAAGTHSLYDAQLPIASQILTPSKIQLDLSSVLSNTSSIIRPDDVQWLNTTERYQTYVTPHVLIVVRPGTEADISKIVRLAF